MVSYQLQDLLLWNTWLLLHCKFECGTSSAQVHPTGLQLYSPLQQYCGTAPTVILVHSLHPHPPELHQQQQSPNAAATTNRAAEPMEPPVVKPNLTSGPTVTCAPSLLEDIMASSFTVNQPFTLIYPNEIETIHLTSASRTSMYLLPIDAASDGLPHWRPPGPFDQCNCPNCVNGINSS